MKNVTIVLDEEVARWLRIRAAEEETSVSRLVGEMLREKMAGEARYDQARAEFDAVRPRKLRKPAESLPTRESLHERSLR